MVEAHFPEVRVIHEHSLPCESFSHLVTKKAAVPVKAAAACRREMGLD